MAFENLPLRASSPHLQLPLPFSPEDPTPPHNPALATSYQPPATSFPHNPALATSYQLSATSSSRDSTALTIVEVDLCGLADEGLKAPIYRASQRVQWTGTPHTSLYGGLKALVDAWQPRWIVIDATGVGSGLASFLVKAYPERVLRFIFSQVSKSQLGWDFLAVVETGRFQDWQEDGDPLQAVFWSQVEACEMQLLPGPEHRLRWGVPDGKRHPKSGERLHDDLLVSAALCAVLDRQEWGLAESRIIAPNDPLEKMGGIY